MTVYRFYPPRRDTSAKVLTVATLVIKISSNELSTSLSDSVKCKQKEVNTYMLNSPACVGSASGCGVMLSSWISILGRGRERNKILKNIRSSNDDQVASWQILLQIFLRYRKKIENEKKTQKKIESEKKTRKKIENEKKTQKKIESEKKTQKKIESEKKTQTKK